MRLLLKKFMGETPKFETEPHGLESKERLQERPNLTVFLMRHGESEEDKTKANRGLTERGQQQVTENFNKIIDQLITEGNPLFSDFEDAEKRKEAARIALAKVELHLADSKTDRTMEQAFLERQILLDLGLKPEEIALSKASYEWAKEKGLVDQIPEKAGPGIEKRLKGVKGIGSAPEFRKKIDNPEYQKQIGAQDTMIAWALTPEDEIPAGVENRRQMENRLETDLAKVQHASQKLQNREKRVIYIANSHSSIITLAASKKFGLPIEEIGEVENAEGIRFDFYGGQKEYKARPFGQKLESKVEAKE